MNSNMFQSAGMSQQVVGKEPDGMLPGPVEAPNQQGMSDLQFMLDNERKQHQQRYNYEFGNTEMGQ